MRTDRLKTLRNQRKWTQQELADKLGIARPTVIGYEKGERKPDLDMIKKIAELFDVTTDYLIGRESKQPQLEPKPTSRDKKDLKKMLEESEVMFDGVPLTDEDKQRVQDVLTGLFWEAKQMNKRKKNTGDKDTE